MHYLYGKEDQLPWQKLDKPKFICPVPGYDRHFAICENLNIEMITVPMLDSGPDMDAVEELLKSDEQIVGMWNVPKYSNPTGITYSDETVERIAKLTSVAKPHFHVFWDNAYALHTLEQQPRKLANIWDISIKHGSENNIWQFASTSKISFAGAGLSWVASSAANLTSLKKVLGVTTIGADKVNQLRHTLMFPDLSALEFHMKKHAEILQSKFEIVSTFLEKELQEYGSWTEAKGGYFISFNSKPRLASKIVKMALDVGLKLTPAGATFPYGKDPEDQNIRIAPTYPSNDELKKAMEIFVVCVKLATVQQQLSA
jgi:DNA-binding transcriptional MocR family regulator